MVIDISFFLFRKNSTVFFSARDVEMEELRNENEHLEDENKHLKTQVSNLTPKILNLTNF